MTLTYEDVLKHYERPQVKVEIARFSRGRWVGLHCMERDAAGKPRLIRYFGRGGTPLTIDEPEDVAKILEAFRKFKPRTFYATANVYNSLKESEDVKDLSNIIACTPTWDIDNAVEDWKTTMAVAREIASFLEGKGVERSLIIKWSGRAAHVHIHPMAISPEIREKISPLDLAYVIVEYVNSKLHSRYMDIILKCNSSQLRVDNEMDPQRLFSCMLSLHRELDRVCVCIPLNSLDDFDLSWADVESYRHSASWDNYVIGEADQLAIEAYEAAGGCPYVLRMRRRKHPPLDREIMRWVEKAEYEG